RLLVAVDYAIGIILHCAERDETLAGEPLSGVRDCEFLEIRKNGWFGVSRQNAGRDPVIQNRAGAWIDSFRCRIGFATFAQKDAHDVERTKAEIPGLHCWRDLVIGLRHQVFEVTGLLGVAEWLKWIDACHSRIGLRPVPALRALDRPQAYP